ncbi:efflux RND transporter periplasmic adaptor subunit [Dyadobacter frigoris]|uniref:Efflux RND transporter periplasmic adaptor subunit n=1 Tax=Dyadobacter frigoris TaxID=2576211 RepID=A0A4U6D2G7_9BACT|nr:efflux RND transporter periplasmic adaptor subunit [Dyadobacter frigoris]TKT88054.1 efflux RND transporter periplasmic adaptor subunit [Dyadobacter frigoris]GLU52960.1 MexH family multidrug efflux RND transporter periplasmic adaptor subunit [Dyadobacter frigoris]
MKRKYIISIGLLAVILLITYKLTANKKQIDENNTPQKKIAVKIPVKYAAAKEQLLELSIIKTGNLAPFKESKVITTSSGILQKVRFELGDQVRQGQVLAVMDNRTAQLDLQKAGSSLAKLKADVQTYTELLEGKATTREKLSEIRQNYNDAQVQVDQIKKQLADASVKAPTSGTISTKNMEEGVFANAGSEIATIINLTRTKVQVNLTEAEVYQIKTGQSVKITTDVYPDVVFPGKVSFISPQADATHNYLAEIMIDNTSQSPLRSGTFVYADFSRKSKQTILVIPREALTESVKNASVYVIGEDNRVTLKSVQPGRETEGFIEIISGLKAADRVVTSGQINLKNGSEVSLSN